MRLFGGLFDFNRNGKTDPLELGALFALLHAAEEEDKAAAEFDEDEELLDFTGYEREDLEMMDEEERRSVLEDSGLDPDDYDFF